MSAYASKGESVTCENGHHICDMAEDLHFGQMNWRGSFGNWSQPEPKMVSPQQSCQECGAPWLRNDWELHFSEGWRPLPTKDESK